MQTREILAASPVMPVLVIESAEQAVPLARALVAGGIRMLEVTLRTPSAPRYTASRHQKQPPARMASSVFGELSAMTVLNK